MLYRCVLAAGAAVLLASCAGHSHLPIGPGALVAAGPASPVTPQQLEEYRIGPRDVLRVAVFNEPELSFEQLPVSSGGTIALPLIGTVPAAGRTSAELAADIDSHLNARYLRAARTAVSVVTATNYTVTVDGAVTKPGIYEIPGQLRLSQALAIAGGSAQYARLDEVIVFRDIDGKPYAARFDLNRVRTGQTPDLKLRQGDTVIVGINNAARLFRDIVATLPSAAALFVAIRR